MLLGRTAIPAAVLGLPYQLLRYPGHPPLGHFVMLILEES